jgi:hypothetical protein
VSSDRGTDLAPLTGTEREWCRRVRDSDGARFGSGFCQHIVSGRDSALWECQPAPPMAESLNAHVACLPSETRASPARARGILHTIAWATGRADAPITVRSLSVRPPSARELEDEEAAAATVSTMGMGVEARHFLSGVVACLRWLKLPDGGGSGLAGR